MPIKTTLKNLNITAIANIRWPSELADARLMVKMAENFSLFGHKTTLLIPNRSQTNPALTNKSAWRYYDINPRAFTVKKLFCLDPLSLLRLGLWQPLLNFSFLLTSALFVKSIKSILLVQPSKQRTDMIYTYQKEFILLKPLLPQTKFVLEFHDQPSSAFQQRLFSLVKSKVDLWITPTKALARFLSKSGISASNIITTPAGVDLAKYTQLTKLQARKTLRLPPKAKLIGYVGRLRGKDGSRGLEDVLSALAKLKIKNVYFICVGGPQEEILKLKKLTASLAIANRCIFTGQVSHQLIPTYLASFDACLLPFPNTPHYRHHMSPMKMVEYLAAKRPIVTTDLPSIRETLDESSAIFVKPSNPTSLAQGIRRSLNPAITKPLINNSYKIVKSLTWTNRAKLIVNNPYH